jgi:TRAP-type C4-dicarboxylate transport system permease large subunit
MANMITNLHVHPMIVVWIIIAIYMVLGTAMEEASMILLTIPIFTPLIANLGMDKVWFGIVVVRMMMVAMISPPVGMTLFIVKGLAKDVPMTTIYKGVMPFIWADTANVLLVVFVPAVTLWLPSLM